MNVRKVIKGGAWFLGFSILAKVIAFFNKIYLTRMLTLADYGLFISMFSLFGIVLTFSSFGLNTSMVKFIPHYRVRKEPGKIKSVITSILQFEIIMRLIIYIVLLKVAPLLSIYYFKTDATTPFQLFSVMVLTELAYRNLKPFFKSFKQTVMLGWIEFLTPALYGIFFFIFFKYDTSVYVPIVSYILTSALIGGVFGLIALRTFNIFKHKGKQEWSIFKKMVAFGFPLIVANTGGIFISYFDTIMLTSLSTLEIVGIYNIALSSALLMAFVFNSISITLIPTVSEMIAKKKQKDIMGGLKKLYRYSLFALVPIVAIGITFAKPLLTFIYGNEYGSGFIAFRILLIGAVFVALNNYNIRCLIGAGNTKAIAKVTWLSAIINIVFNIPFIYYWGITGAAIATTVSYACQWQLTTYQTKKSLGETNV